MMQHNGQTEPCKQSLRYALEVDPNLAGAREMLARLQGPPAGAVRPAASLSFASDEDGPGGAAH
jgi:hypothetical protein